MANSSALAVIDGQALTKKDIMTTVDDLIVELRQTDNQKHVTTAFNAFNEIDKVSGLAKAKLLWHWHVWYKETNQAEKQNDTFEDMIESDTEFTKVSTRRYIRTWTHIENGDIPKEIQSRRMDDLIKIATVLSHGYEISKEQWKEIQHASNSAEVAEHLRRITGAEPRKSGIQITIGRNGAITAWKDKNVYSIGYLFVEDENEVVKKVIQRIIDGAGIMEK